MFSTTTEPWNYSLRASASGRAWVGALRNFAMAGWALATIGLVAGCASGTNLIAVASPAMTVANHSVDGEFEKVVVFERGESTVIVGEIWPTRVGWPPGGHIDIAITAQGGKPVELISTYLRPENTLWEQEPEKWEFRAVIPGVLGKGSKVTVGHHVGGPNANGVFDCGQNVAARSGVAMTADEVELWPAPAAP